MNVCIIGDGLTSLSLAKNLVNKKINVHIYHKKKITSFSKNRTIGISKNNFDFFEKEILLLKKKFYWKIKKIEIFSEKLKYDRILHFEKNDKSLFYMVKNYELYKLLNNNLLKSNFFKKKQINDNNFFQKILKKNYDLIINCDKENFFAKKFFFKKIVKDYYNFAYTTIINHEKLDNNKATQIFTDLGPIAFLPISKTQTSVVYSLDIKNKKYSKKDIYSLIEKYNPQFKIKSFIDLSGFKLKSSRIRNYYHNNILAFGDSLHTVHPLAGQGFNMTIRDISILSRIIQERIDLGLQLDSFILKEFESKTKHMNFIFSSGIDFIYEFFNFDKKINNTKLTETLQLFGKNKLLKNTLIKFADLGFRI